VFLGPDGIYYRDAAAVDVAAGEGEGEGDTAVAVIAATPLYMFS
jgi:hypothetical protein